MEWLAKVAKQGHAAAANNLAVMLWEGGDGFEGDPVKAFPWTLILANQGDVENQNRVGRYYLIGYGGFQKAPKIAVEWFKKAAELNLVEAKQRIDYLRANDFAHDDWLKNLKQRWDNYSPEIPTLLPPDDLSTLVIYSLRK